MSSVDEFVRTSILAYPTLYKSRTEVLHHALCVIGNGYMWGEQGIIITSTYEAPKRPWTEEDAFADMESYLESSIGSPDIRDMVRPAFVEDIKNCTKIVAEIDTRMHLRTPIKSFYPQSVDYALIHNAPENITDDWAEACVEMRELAIAAGWKF